MRSKKALLNFIAAIVELVVATIASFVVPNYIIHEYGSNVNGLIASITQFLSYIALVESGIGAIGRASLYKPLAKKDTSALSQNVKALENFYHKVGYVYLGYVALLAACYPLLVKSEFEWGFSAVLVVILAFSHIIQYFYGITYQTVIQADQRKYVVSLLQAGTLLLNMILTIVMVNMKMDISIVKIGSAFAFAIRPLFLFFYVSRHYRIDKSAKPNNMVLKQRWDGLAQHIAFFIHKNTDIAVLTILTNVKEVSVYSVYMLAVAGCSKVVNLFSSSLQPAFGNMIANGEKEVLKKRVDLCSTLTIQISVVMFTTVAVIISPFVKIYTTGITDVNYLRVPFGLLMLIAEAFYCIRLPFQSAIYAAGRFKETRNGAIAQAAINIVLSIIMVINFGLIGVAIGTLVAMLVRTCQYIWYYHKKLIQDTHWLRNSLKKVCVSLFEVALIVLCAHFLPSVSEKGYLMWFLSSCVIACCSGVITLLVSLVFYRDRLTQIIRILMRIMKHG